jgi:hypothetical protein
LGILRVNERRLTMHTFTEKLKTSQHATSAKSTDSSRAHFGQNRDNNAILHLQRAIGNQAVQRMFQSNAEKSEAALIRPASSRFGHDVKRIPVHPSNAAEPSTKTANEAPQVEQRKDGRKGEQREEMSSYPTFSTVGVVKLASQGVTHPIAALLNQPGVRFRLPEFNRVKAAYTDKTLKIPEAVIKSRVTQLLERMEKEKRLKTTDSVPTIIGKIFPAPGKIDETEFNNALDVTDRSVIYKDVFEAETSVKSPDEAKLKTAIKDSIGLIKKVEGDAPGLNAVFGTKSATAKGNYGKARDALNIASNHMASHISTDYNLDDPEVGLGGWANFSSQQIHLLVKVVKVVDPNETKITLIHEASHLADSTVVDQGYYGSPGFEAMTEDEKLGNAAHYEELPRRELGKSKFPVATFTPGVKVGGGVVTREDRVKRDASEFLRKAWDAAVDTHSFIRGLRQAYLKGNATAFTTNQAIIMEISKLMDLSVHEQAVGHALVTTLDVTLSESVARAVKLIWNSVYSVPFPSPVGVLTDVELREKIVAAAVAKYGNLLKDPKRDKALLEWFFAHYQKVPSV